MNEMVLSLEKRITGTRGCSKREWLVPIFRRWTEPASVDFASIDSYGLCDSRRSRMPDFEHQRQPELMNWCAQPRPDSKLEERLCGKNMWYDSKLSVTSISRDRNEFYILPSIQLATEKTSFPLKLLKYFLSNDLVTRSSRLCKQCLVCQ